MNTIKNILVVHNDCRLPNVTTSFMAAKSNEVPTLICRICLLGTQDKYCSLFEPFKDHSPAYHINSISNIHINEQDSLPDRICNTCLLDLDNAIGFKLKCESSDAYLKKTLDEINAEPSLPKLELLDSNGVYVKEEKNNDYEEDYLEDDNIYDDEQDFNSTNNNINKKKKYQRSDFSDDDDDDNVNVKVDIPAKCPVICHDCGGIFKSKCKLRVHWKREHKHYLDCELCKARFCSMKAFRNHKLTSTARCKLLNTVTIDGYGKKRIFICPTCNYSSNRALNMLQHLPIHTGERKYVCPTCGKAYIHRSTLIAHKESTHQMNKKVSTCEICGKEIEGQYRFYKHMTSIHSTRIFECDICHKVLKSRATMVNHLRIHEGIKTLSCEFCGKNFVTASNLANHKYYTHLNKKKFSCCLCDYKSFNKHAMDAHVARHGHNGFSCDFCGKFFESEIRLWIHKLCHLPMESPARRTCHFCGRVYLKNQSMVTHVRNVHIKKDKGTGDLSEVISRIQTELVNSEQSYHRTKY